LTRWTDGAKYLIKYLFFAMPEGAGSIRVTDQGDGLTLTLEQPGMDGPVVDSPLELVGEDLATFEYTGLTVFTDFIREDGEVTWIRFVGRTYPRTSDTP
jgi:hypothetical protein